MVIHLAGFVLTLILLLFPRPWMRAGAIVRKRRRSAAERVRSAEPWNARSPGDPRVTFGREFRRFRNYIDLLRAGAGALLLTGELGVTACLAAEPDAPRMLVRGVIILRALILLAAVLIQTVRWEHGRLTFYPPVFFLSGLSLALCGPWAALFSVVLIWAVSPAFANAQIFLVVYAVLLFVFGHQAGGLRDFSTDYMAFLAFLPVLLSLLAKKPLIVLTRKGTHGAHG